MWKLPGWPAWALALGLFGVYGALVLMAPLGAWGLEDVPLAVHGLAAVLIAVLALLLGSRLFAGARDTSVASLTEVSSQRSDREATKSDAIFTSRFVSQ